MALKTKIDLVYDDIVPASSTDIKQSAIVPNGRKVTLKIFGGADPSVGDGIDSYAVLQWGNGSTWQTIRAGIKTWDFVLSKDFVGNGADRFRLLRVNKSTVNKPIVVWLEALVHSI